MTDQNKLRERIADIIHDFEHGDSSRQHREAVGKATDAVLAVVKPEMERLRNAHWSEMVKRYKLVADDPDSPFKEYMVCTNDGEYVKRLDFLALQAHLAMAVNALRDIEQHPAITDHSRIATEALSAIEGAGT